MEREGLRAGHLLVLLGAAVLVASLWLPWYEVQLGAAQRSQATAGAAQLDPRLAAIAEGFLSRLDGLRLSGWTAFRGADVALAGCSALVAVVVVAAAGGLGPGVRVEPGVAARGAVVAGLALGALVLYHLITRPAPAEILALAAGGPVALAGCGAMLAGGVWAATTARSTVLAPSASWPPPGGDEPARTVARPVITTSVAPPPARH